MRETQLRQRIILEIIGLLCRRLKELLDGALKLCELCELLYAPHGPELFNLLYSGLEHGRLRLDRCGEIGGQHLRGLGHLTSEPSGHLAQIGIIYNVGTCGHSRRL